MSVILVCYADGPSVHLRNQGALVRSAAGAGIDRVLARRRADIAPEFHRAHRPILEVRRGAGCWLWKPYVIHEALAQAEPDDVVVYLDAGIVIRRSLEPLIAETRRRGLVVFGSARPHSAWTKRDCFVLTGTDVPECHRAPQVQACAVLVRNTEANRRFVKTWLDYCADDRVLTDRPNACGEPNLPGFVDHRHDQATLSVLLWRERDRLDHFVARESLKRQHLVHHRRRTGGVPIGLWRVRNHLRTVWSAMKRDPRLRRLSRDPALR